MNRSLISIILISLGGLLLAAAFVPTPAAYDISYPPIPDWSLADVRALDPADAAAPTHDVLAVYLHPSGQDLDLRLDFLDSAPLPDYDLLIAIDSAPGGTRLLPLNRAADIGWEALLYIPAHGALRLLDTRLQPLRGAGMRVLRNPGLDQLSVRVSGLQRAGGLARAQVFVLPAGWGPLADSTSPGPVGRVSLRPAQVGMVFSNVFPAYSAATALRRWRGAHSGPLGGSHGLALLLNAAQAAGVPLALRDLRRPEPLAALDSVSPWLTLVREMQAQNLLVLPGQDDSTGAALEKAVDRAFGLAPERPALAPLFGRSRVLMLDDSDQVEQDGPTLEVSRALIEAALAANRSPYQSAPVILGGELPDSAWGAANRAQAAFHYLQSRPWIAFLGADELASAAASAQPLHAPAQQWHTPALSAQERASLLAALEAAPQNALGQAAVQAYSSLNAPVFQAAEQLPALRANYVGVVWSLLAAAQWAERPQAIETCQADPDRDGAAECVLANARWYAQFETQPPILTQLFSREADGAHQWIAPSAQFITGMSDAHGWDLSRGLLADPAVIPGAFYEAEVDYRFSLENGRLDFWSVDGSAEKLFSLQSNGLRAEYFSPAGLLPAQVVIALAPDPWLRFGPFWFARYSRSINAARDIVEVQTQDRDFTTLQVRGSCDFSVEAFSDSQGWLYRPENPDREYPPGHYLPFPMLRVKCNPGNRTRINIEIGRPTPGP